MPAHHIWELVLRIALIVVFGVTGLARIFWPDYFVRSSSGINGNRTRVRCFGAIYIALVAFMLYDAFLASRHGV